MTVEVLWARPRSSQGLTAVLDGAERTRLGSLHRSADRDRYVAAHALLRASVARRSAMRPDEVPLDVTCSGCGGPHGPPTLASTGGPALQLSLSRAGDRVVVAVSDAGPVGVDVEPVTKAFPGVDAVAFADEEREAIGHLPPAERLPARVHAWVRKESVLKAAGCGLRGDPRQLIIGAEPAVRAWDGGPLRPASLHLHDLDIGPGRVACLTQVGDRPAAVRLMCGDGLLDRLA